MCKNLAGSEIMTNVTEDKECAKGKVNCRINKLSKQTKKHNQAVVKGKSEGVRECCGWSLHTSRLHLQKEEATESSSCLAKQTSVNALQLAGLGKQ